MNGAGLSCFILLASLLVAAGQLPCGTKPPQAPWPLTSDGQEERIVGGRNATAGSWPWQLSLQFLRENTTDDWRHTCGASVIDPYWALTAAHCVTGRMVGINDTRREDPENFRILAGATNLLDLQAVQIIGLDLIIRHDRWEPNPYLGYPNDIALLRLKTPVDLLQINVELACIPNDVNFNFTGEECWITGWGLTDWTNDDIPDRLQEAQVEAISNDYCRELNFGYIRDSHICAGTGYPNACSGDSGGPMSCLKNGIWYQAGLTSWGIVFCQGVPGVYTRTSDFWNWMQLEMGMNPPPSKN